MKLQNSGDARGLRKLFVFLGRRELAGVLVLCYGLEAERIHSLQYRLGRGEMIAVSRHPVLAAFPFNVGHRISFAETPHDVIPITDKYGGLMALPRQAQGRVPPDMLHLPSPTFRFLIRRHNGFPLRAMVVFLVGAPVF